MIYCMENSTSGLKTVCRMSEEKLKELQKIVSRINKNFEQPGDLENALNLTRELMRVPAFVVIVNSYRTWMNIIARSRNVDIAEGKI